MNPARGADLCPMALQRGSCWTGGTPWFKINWNTFGRKESVNLQFSIDSVFGLYFSPE